MGEEKVKSFKIMIVNDAQSEDGEIPPLELRGVLPDVLRKALCALGEICEKHAHLKGHKTYFLVDEVRSPEGDLHPISRDQWIELLRKLAREKHMDLQLP